VAVVVTPWLMVKLRRGGSKRRAGQGQDGGPLGRLTPPALPLLQGHAGLVFLLSVGAAPSPAC
jgi:hypothetical protein